MASTTVTRRSRALTDQLVVLPTRGEAGKAVMCVLDHAHEGHELDIRDAVVLTQSSSEVRVIGPSAGWPGRQRLGRRWWRALAAALEDVAASPPEGTCDRGWRSLVDAGMSKSFLQEAATALATSSTTLLLFAERIDVRALLAKLEQGEFARIIYGSLPYAAVDELATAGHP
ncbi:MAG TPA: hypothetical protein VGJ03_13055 [Acidimicrobiales bacterium]